MLPNGGIDLPDLTVEFANHGGIAGALRLQASHLRTGRVVS